MISMEVKDMTCGHCESKIRKVIAAVDPNASVKFDLAAHRVNIDTHTVDLQTLEEAVQAAGYTPGQIAQVAPSAPAKRAGSCCCG